VKSKQTSRRATGETLQRRVLAGFGWFWQFSLDLAGCGWCLSCSFSSVVPPHPCLPSEFCPCLSTTTLHFPEIQGSPRLSPLLLPNCLTSPRPTTFIFPQGPFTGRSPFLLLLPFLHQKYFFRRRDKDIISSIGFQNNNNRRRQ
jgi:hypothetical protein